MNEMIAVQGLTIGLLMLSAYFFGRLTNQLKFGQTIGQLIGGIFVGPYFLDAVGLTAKYDLHVYGEAFESFHFVIFVFLGVIAFALGEELHFDRFRRIGKTAAVISGVQGVLSWILIFGTFVLLGMPIELSAVFGSIGIATAPAITLVLLNHHEITGRFRNLVANILVISDVLEVVVFSIIVQVAVKLTQSGDLSAGSIAGHVVQEFGLALLIGGGIFLILRLLVRKEMKTEDEISQGATFGSGLVSRILTANPTPSVEILVVIIGVVAVGTGLGLGLHIPFLISAIFAGILISNLHTHALFDSLKIDNIMPLLNMVFFAMIGAHIRLDSFNIEHIGFVLAYVAARGVGKVFGTYLGCRMTKQGPKVRHCLPYLMLPQAGVAAVESVYVVMLLGQKGQAVADVILPALVVFELVGVLFSEKTLIKWRQWTTGEEDLIGSSAAKLAEVKDLDPRVFKRFSRFVPDGLAGVRISAVTFSEALRVLAQRLKDAGQVDDVDEVVRGALEREKMATTAIGNGVSLPHCKVSADRDTVCAVGFLENEVIGLKPADSVPVRAIVLLVSSTEHPKEHLRALASVAHVFAEEKARKSFFAELENGTADLFLQKMQTISGSEEEVEE